MLRLDKPQTLFFIILSFCLGTIIGVYEIFDLYFVIAGFILSIISFFVMLLYNKRPAIFLLFIFFFCMILLSYETNNKQVEFLDVLYNEKIYIHGTIQSDIELKDRFSKYRVKADTIQNMVIEENIYFLVYEKDFSGCSFGDRIEFEGKLLPIEDFVSEYKRIFPYRNYLLSSSVYGQFFIFDPQCSKGETTIKSFFAGLRDVILNKINKLYTSDEGALLAGILLGIKSTFSESLFNAFKLTGLVHIVILSGYNVLVVAESIISVFKNLAGRKGLIIACFFVVMFILLSSGGVPALRAGSMTILALFARYFYKELDAIKLLIGVLIGFSILNPSLLVYDVSFQMSFLATFGLLLYSDKLKNRLSFITDKFQLREIVSVTFAVSLFLLPYLIFRIGFFSVVSFLANMLVLPIVPITMFLGCVVILLSFVSPPLAVFILPISQFFLSFINNVAVYLSKFEFAYIEISTIPIFFIVLIYLILFAPLYRIFNLHKLFS